MNHPLPETGWTAVIADFLAVAPPPAPGSVRLYRIEAACPASSLAPWLAEALERNGSHAATGRWFTDAPEALAFYAADAPTSPRLVYGDASAEQASRWCVASFAREGTLEPQRFSRDPSREFFVPAEWAQALPRHALDSPRSARRWRP